MLIMSLFWPNFNIDRSTCDVFSDCSPNVLVYNAFGKMDKAYLVKDNIDSNKLGEYELEYGVKFLFIRIKKKFRISVIDKEEPSTLLAPPISPTTLLVFSDRNCPKLYSLVRPLVHSDLPVRVSPKINMSKAPLISPL